MIYVLTLASYLNVKKKNEKKKEKEKKVGYNNYEKKWFFSLFFLSQKSKKHLGFIIGRN